ncbi:hypothetical protein QM467_17265 [Rhodoblastus sp. 17X3]|uniref:hypothetical protein n=1 Tax=Rhodoblastus sp. 17X3 TaxID=3047026 RepID=UPI0024B7757B|nr:hypothetical protein [Rhodoblastus sp. 17X3]MDI9849798.1 hypothetical protein [Rhodoblastus sp. 17X3]
MTLAAGEQLTTDLTNFGNLVSSLKHGANAPGHGAGSQTNPETTGGGIGASANLDNGGKLELKDLLANNTPPVHRG